MRRWSAGEVASKVTSPLRSKGYSGNRFGSKNGIATQSGDEDDTFGADAPLADAAFGK